MAGFGLKEAMMVASILPIGGILPGGKHETVSKKGSLMEGIGDTIRVSLSDDPVKEIKIGNEILKSLSLRKPRINNSVRRVLSATIGKLQLQSSDPVIRLAAAKQLLKKSSGDLVELVEKALAKETNGEIRDIYSLVLAKEGLNSENKQKRLESLKIIREFGDNDFKDVLEGLLRKNNNYL